MASWLEGVPKIVLIQMTKKLVKNNFLNTFWQKRQIWSSPKVFKPICRAFLKIFFTPSPPPKRLSQEGKMLFNKDWFTMAVSRATILSEHWIVGPVRYRIPPSHALYSRDMAYGRWDIAYGRWVLGPFQNDMSERNIFSMTSGGQGRTFN